ncbi:MAG: hypothetical protein C0621_09505 [Desulfuromonas sp.]|nr:MAG: hypothetical protein C0621_09505 [Desulfuromonas sp.]
MKGCSVIFTLLFLVLLFGNVAPVFAADDEGSVITLWPLLDYRRVEQADYTSLSLLGPFLKYERKGNEREYGIRPLWHRASDPVDGISRSEYLYPVATRRSEPERDYFQMFHLLEWDFGSLEERRENEAMLFPFLFYGSEQDGDSYFAFFPLGGSIHNRFGRDRIRFTLFPLYMQTERRGATNTHILWPFFSILKGKNEHGWGFWPFYGSAEKEGVYRKRYWLWPFFFRHELRLNSGDPVYVRAFFPLYTATTSRQYRSRSYLWPLYEEIEDRGRDYRQWDVIWPLIRVARGSYKEANRFFPFFSRERVGDYYENWWLWPLYKYEATLTENIERQRHRILFFLYSDLTEKLTEAPEEHLHRVALWPLFTYEMKRGVSHVHVLSLFEPFFPESEEIERNWSPLWRIYQHRWDRQGNEATTLLWNLYWKERQGEDLALELFPLFRYRREGEEVRDLSLFKGLVRYLRHGGRKELRLFFLPWGFAWGDDDAMVPLASSEG